MIEIFICGAAHPTNGRLFCCFGADHKTPHSAPIRRGQWVEWQKTSAMPRPRMIVSSAGGEVEIMPRVVYLTEQHYGSVGSKSKGRCWYCGVGFSTLKRTLDHVVPRSKGGSDNFSNLVFACQPCNYGKGALSLEAYRQYVQDTQKQGRVVFYGETLYDLRPSDGDLGEKEHSTLLLSLALESNAAEPLGET